MGVSRTKQLFREIGGMCHGEADYKASCITLTLDPIFHGCYVDIYVRKFKRKNPVDMVMRYGGGIVTHIKGVPLDVPRIKLGLRLMEELRVSINGLKIKRFYTPGVMVYDEEFPYRELVLARNETLLEIYGGD